MDTYVSLHSHENRTNCLQLKFIKWDMHLTIDVMSLLSKFTCIWCIQMYSYSWGSFHTLTYIRMKTSCMLCQEWLTKGLHMLFLHIHSDLTNLLWHGMQLDLTVDNNMPRAAHRSSGDIKPVCLGYWVYIKMDDMRAPPMTHTHTPGGGGTRSPPLKISYWMVYIIRGVSWPSL